MKIAWVEYHEDSMFLRKISWKKSSEHSIEISATLAEDFMNGREHFSNWEIIKDDNTQVLNRKPSYIINPINSFRFCNLTKLDKSIQINDNNVSFSSNASIVNSTVFVTKKNDPSWLISIFIIGSENLINDTVNIMVPNAEYYSYYLGIPHEI